MRLKGIAPLPGKAPPRTPRCPSLNLLPMRSDPVVITGLGVVSGYGLGALALWQGLASGQSALKPITRLNVGATPGLCGIAAEIPPALSAKDYVPKPYRKAVKLMARDTELAVIAAAEGVRDAGIITRALAEGATATTYPSPRMGCHIGAGFIPAEVPEIAPAFASACDESGAFSMRAWGTIHPGQTAPAGGGGMNNLQPLWMLKYLPNMLACHVTIVHGAEGPSNTITCGEASALLSIGESTRIIERGAADLCFSGGAESKVNLLGLVRAALLKRTLVGTHDRPLPYDPASPGSAPGEGGGIIILERASTAAQRNARIYARISGIGAAQSVSRGRNGLALAVQAALRDANLKPSDISAVVPQSVGAAEADAHEAAGLLEVFGAAQPSRVLIGAALGDCAAGAGGLAVAIAAMCVHGGFTPTGHPARHVLACTGSLTGQNAAAIVSAM
jgi:3-oxoacyl-[acyl-carrier-protein] synthase II